MQVSINNQVYIFLCTVAGGMLVAFIYDLFRIKRKAVRMGSLFIHVEDLLYWLIVAVVIIGVIYYSNDGEIRGYIFLGTILGVIIYALLLSKIIMKIFLLIIHTIYKITKMIWTLISYPFRIVFKILAVPGRFLAVRLKKKARIARNIGKNKLEGIVLWRRLFKNIRKKI